MQISDLLVKKCYSSITFCGFLRKKDTFLKEFPLSSMRNSKSCSADVFSFLNILQKSIICHGISYNILHNFDTYFFIIFP